MNSLIRKLQEDELKDFARLSINAFSVEGSSEEAENGYLEFLNMVHNSIKEQHIYGVFRDEQLVGGMRMIDYKMNVRNKLVDIGGAAGVATDLLHKREKVAKDLIEYFIRYYRENGAVMTVLYPFRADFYKRMGFGFGTEIREYKIKPSEFPKGSSKAKLVYMDGIDRNLLKACYKRFAEKHNGMTMKVGQDYFRLFYEGNNRIVAYKEGDLVKGYINFTFKNECNTHNMVINEFIYENKEALKELCTFLHDQADQINRVIIKTQDDNLHYLFKNPSNGQYMQVYDMAETVISEVAVGMMYRVINVKRMFELLDDKCFGDCELKVKLSVKDDLIKENNDTLILHFLGGKVTVVPNGEYEVEVSLDIDNFSSMLMGAVNFSRLYSLDLIEIDKEDYIEKISRIFALNAKPMCTSTF